MKNVTYFILKPLFALEIFTFYSWLVGYVEKRLDKKAWLTTNFMTSQTEQQIVTINILPNFSKGEDNQTIKFGQS